MSSRPRRRSTARWPQPPPGARPLRELAPVLQAHLGSLHVANGNLHEAAAAFSRGTDATAWSPARTECLGRLAHVRALQGDLRRAGRVAGLVPTPVPGVASPGAAHAQLARAWIALERADFADARRRLELVAFCSGPHQEAWLATSVLLVEARLLIASGEPDAATRLIVGAAEVGSVTGGSGWLADILTIAKAEALLASGESQRALATLTPVPHARRRRCGRRGGRRPARHRRHPGRPGRPAHGGGGPRPRATGSPDPGVAARVPPRGRPGEARPCPHGARSGAEVGHGRADAPARDARAPMAPRVRRP